MDIQRYSGTAAPAHSADDVQTWNMPLLVVPGNGAYA